MFRQRTVIRVSLPSSWREETGCGDGLEDSLEDTSKDRSKDSLLKASLKDNSKDSSKDSLLKASLLPESRLLLSSSPKVSTLQHLGCGLPGLEVTLPVNLFTPSQDIMDHHRRGACCSAFNRAVKGTSQMC